MGGCVWVLCGMWGGDYLVCVAMVMGGMWWVRGLVVVDVG